MWTDKIGLYMDQAEERFTSSLVNVVKATARLLTANTTTESSLDTKTGNISTFNPGDIIAVTDNCIYFSHCLRAGHKALNVQPYTFLTSALKTFYKYGGGSSRDEEFLGLGFLHGVRGIFTYDVSKTAEGPIFNNRE
jgi:hypothetical protein